MLLGMVIPGHLVFCYSISYLRAGHTSLTPTFLVVYNSAALLQVTTPQPLCSPAADTGYPYVLSRIPVARERLLRQQYPRSLRSTVRRLTVPCRCVTAGVTAAAVPTVRPMYRD